MRSLTDKKGEQFAYLENNILFDMNDVATGKLEGEFIVDMVGNRVWRVVGDCVYTKDSSESIGFLGGDHASLDYLD